MSNEENIKNLVTAYNRRLQKLKERQALEGTSVDPLILIEIEDIEAKIKELCDTNGVNFSVCFDANGNYDIFKSLWANAEDCCCAKGMIKGFKKTARDARLT